MWYLFRTGSSYRNSHETVHGMVIIARICHSIHGQSQCVKPFVGKIHVVVVVHSRFMTPKEVVLELFSIR
jgi:hypothetical protein